MGSVDPIFNHLHGSIPSSIGLLSELSTLNLGYNNLTGPIPSSMGYLTSLTSVYLGHNQLSRAIPESLGLLTLLQLLKLSYNQLTGTFLHRISIESYLTNLCRRGSLFALPTDAHH